MAQFKLSRLGVFESHVARGKELGPTLRPSLATNGSYLFTRTLLVPLIGDIWSLIVGT